MIFAEKLAGFSHDDEVASGAARRFVDATFFFGHSRAGIDRLACGFPTFKSPTVRWETKHSVDF